MFWLLRVLLGATEGTVAGEERLRGTACRKLEARVDLEKASAATTGELRVPSVDRFEKLRALPVTVWIDDEHVRRIMFEHPELRQLTLELWDFGLATDEFDWTRLPTFRSPEEAALSGGEVQPWQRRALRKQVASTVSYVTEPNRSSWTRRL